MNLEAENNAMATQPQLRGIGGLFHLITPKSPLNELNSFGKHMLEEEILSQLFLITSFLISM